MSARIHRMPQRLFDALAAGEGGAESIRELAAAQYSKHVILLRGVLATAEAAGAQQAQLASQGYELLAAAQRHDPAAANAVVRYPSVGAWALRTASGLSDGTTIPAAEPSGLCAIAAAAALRAGLLSEIDVPVNSGVVTLPSLGVASVDGEHAVVRNDAGTRRIVWPGGRIDLSSDSQSEALGWSGIRHIRAGPLELRVDDVDPFRMPAAPYLASRLPAEEVEAWGGTFQQAWQLLEQHHPSIASEVQAAISVVVPLQAPSSGRVSSSSPETFGAIALSEPSDPCTLAVTLAHELQHLKLSALLDIVPLTRPDDGRRFYAPWRDDPRPVSALLQGAYAFLGVSGFWRDQRHLESGDAGIRANAEFARWRSAAAQVVATLRSSERLTPAGLDFVQGMSQTLAAWQDDPVPREARTLAQHETEQHLALWQSANGPDRDW
jgi:HEXXH motif-containing protein